MPKALSRRLSLWLFLVCRCLLRSLLGFKLRREAKLGTTPRWRGYGEILERRPLFFHYAMLQAPRWNCHAVLGVLPAFRVVGHIRVDLGAARRSASAWTLVVYAGDSDSRAVAAIGPDREADADGFFRLALAPGIYRLGARYYDCRPGAAWPEIRIDDHLTIPARALGQEAQVYGQYLESLRGRCPLFYRWVHHHAFVALERSAAPTPALDRLILPVGNPETLFRYGLLPAGAALGLRAVPPGCLVFLTLLNRASLPLYWCQIREGTFESPRFAEPALYLVRVQPLAGGKPPSAALDVELVC